MITGYNITTPVHLQTLINDEHYIVVSQKNVCALLIYCYIEEHCHIVYTVARINDIIYYYVQQLQTKVARMTIILYRCYKGRVTAVRYVHIPLIMVVWGGASLLFKLIYVYVTNHQGELATSHAYDYCARQQMCSGFVLQYFVVTPCCDTMYTGTLAVPIQLKVYQSLSIPHCGIQLI